MQEEERDIREGRPRFLYVYDFFDQFEALTKTRHAISSRVTNPQFQISVKQDPVLSMMLVRNVRFHYLF